MNLSCKTDYWEKAAPLSEEVINFFTAMDKHFTPPYSATNGISNTLQLIAEKGGALIKKRNDRIIGLSCYTHGEPVKDYENKDVLYVIFTILDPNERNKKSIITGYLQSLFFLSEEEHHTEIRFKARESNPLLNKMYQKVGRILYQEHNLKGVLCNVYTIDRFGLNNWLERMAKDREELSPA